MTPTEIFQLWISPIQRLSQEAGKEVNKRTLCEEALRELPQLCKLIASHSNDRFSEYTGPTYGINNGYTDRGLIWNTEEKFFQFEEEDLDTGLRKTIIYKKQPAILKIRINSHFNIEIIFESPYYSPKNKLFETQEIDPRSFDKQLLYDTIREFLHFVAAWENKLLLFPDEQETI